MSIESYPSPNGVLTSLIWRKTAVGGETSLSGYDNASQALSYTPGQEQVYLNGILLVRGSDYTATNGTSITGLTALTADDFVQVNCYNNFSVASVPAASIIGEITNSQITSLATTKLTGTITNAQLAGSIANDKLANSSITINGNAISLGGSVSLPGDIESVTASSPLTGGGSSGALTIGIQSASTSQAGAVQLSDSTSTTSSVLAATPTAVKSAYDLANGAIPKTLTTTTGDIIYASGANTPARLGIGSTGNVLTVSDGVPSWAALSSGGMTLLSTTALSSSSVVISDISQTYTNLILFITSYTFSTSTTLQMRVNGNPNYHYVNVLSSNGTVNNSLQTSINVSPAHSSQTDSFSVVEIPDYSGGGKPQIYKVNTISAWNHGVSANQMNNIGGSSPSTTPVSSITLFPASGTFTGGTVRIYGVK